MRRTRVVLSLVVTLSSTAVEHAQSAPALPFRAGQWGAEFSVATQTVGTLLRFDAPDRAWAFGGAVDGNWNWSGTPQEEEAFANVSLRISRRRFRPLTTGVVGYGALGVNVGVSRGINPVLSETRRGVELIAQAGAQWFVLPRLSVGAEAAVSARLVCGWRRESVPFGASQRGTSTGLGLSVGQFGLVGALYS